MSPSDIFPLVEKFPHCTAAEREQLLNFARNTPLLYGAWKPFKQLFKKAQAQLPDRADIELLGVLLRRIDEAGFPSSRHSWKVVDETGVQGKKHSVVVDGVSYVVGGRSSWDYTGWRLVVTRLGTSGQGVLGALRRAIDNVKATPSSTVKAYDFDSHAYIYEVKNVTLANAELSVVSGSSYRWGSSPETTFVVDVSDPEFVHIRGDGPRTPTLQYMKRRARRVLRHLSQHNPTLYLQLATQLLREHGNKTLDPALNWAAMDVLFTSSPRWEQTQPGRGAYQRSADKFVRLRREERAPAIWDAHLEQARVLLSRGDVPLEANEMVLKVLRAHGEDFANADNANKVLSPAQLLRFLNSDAPLLQHLATRELAQAVQRGDQIDGATWARLVLLADARTRRTLSTLQPASDVGDWNHQAVQVLGETLEKKTAAKQRRAAHLLVARFAEQIGPEVLWRNLAIFADASAETREWVFEKVAASASRGEFNRLSELSRLRPDLRDEAVRVFSAQVNYVQPTVAEAMALVATADAEKNAVGWQFLAATAITREVARQLWYQVWGAKTHFASETHAVAARSVGAMQLFERADFSSEKLEKWVPLIPVFIAELSPEFFAAVFRRVSPLQQIDLALSASNEQWQAARAVLLEALQDIQVLGSFWNRVLQRLESEENTTLLERIVDDAEISATFSRVPSSTVAALLERTDPMLESWLALWLDANAGQLSRDDSSLLAAATHQLSAIRERGLARVREVGLNLPLALRLMESGLPQPFATAREWFESHEALDLADRALALCDSPDAQVRAFGREFLEANRERVLDSGLLQKLTENSDVQMQAWLAEHLLKDAPDVQVAGFDQVVLRTRGRARRAKEAVKKRRDATKSGPVEYSDDDVAVLLEVARGRTTRDREWALQQLAQVALSGRDIEGVRVQVVTETIPGAGG